jgi:hypothetical protein
MEPNPFEGCYHCQTVQSNAPGVAQALLPEEKILRTPAADRREVLPCVKINRQEEIPWKTLLAASR